MTIQQVFPGLRSAPAGAILTLANHVFTLWGPADEAFAELSRGYSNHLINQIRQVDPSYRYHNTGFPTTREGQMNQIQTLRLDRAVAYYRKRNDAGPLQVETLRYLQERVDAQYEVGLREAKAGRLKVKLSREEALGNFIDLAVRRELRRFYNQLRISTQPGQQVRVVGREYDSSGSDLTYRIPDARVGRIAFDVTLTRKTLKTHQIIGFFNADMRAVATIIVRPSQLGPNSTYVIVRPERK